MEKTIMDSWIKISSIWAGALLVALALRAIVPVGWGLAIARQHAVLLLRANRLAFWGVLIIGVITAIALIPRAMMKDVIP